MKRICAALAAVFIAASAMAYQAANVRQIGPLAIEVREKNPWNHLELKNRPANFQFVIVSDRTGGHRPGVFEDAVARINLLQPEFVMSVGDLIEGYTEDPQTLATEWQEFNQFIGKLEMPFFYVPGNHDLSNARMLPVWQNQFDRTYFHFTYHDVLFIALNSEDPPGYTVDRPDVDGRPGGIARPGRIGREQLNWLEQVLAQNANVRWTILFLHKPMWEYGDLTNWAEVEALLKDRKRTVFAGHEHRYRRTKVGEHLYYTLATTGGATRLRGPGAGEFDHLAWITMTPEGPRLANLMLEGIWSEDPFRESQARFSDNLERQLDNARTTAERAKAAAEKAKAAAEQAGQKAGIPKAAAPKAGQRQP